MNKQGLGRLFGSLLVGVTAFLVVGIGVTEALAPYIWLSLVVGIPAGLVTGAAGVALTYFGLTYRAERIHNGRASTTTVTRVWATAAALVAFVLVGGTAVVASASVAMGFIAATLFVGFPAGLVAAALAALLVARRVRQRAGPRGPTPQ